MLLGNIHTLSFQTTVTVELLAWIVVRSFVRLSVCPSVRL